MSARRIISTTAAPAAIGPYSQAVVTAGVVYCSGQIAFDPQTSQLIAGDVAAQTERALQNLKAVLEAAGSELARAVKCNVYLVDMAHFPAMNEVYARYFPAGSAPARTTVAVAQLPRGALVEIDCTALA